MRLQLVICHKKELLSSKTRAATQQVLPVQSGLYRYDEWMVRDINNKNLNGNKPNLTEINLVCWHEKTF